MFLKKWGMKKEKKGGLVHFSALCICVMKTLETYLQSIMVGGYQQLLVILLKCESGVKNSHREVLLRKDVLKICSKFTGEHPCRSVISIKLLWNLSPVNLMHIFRTPFLKNTSGWLLLWSLIFLVGFQSFSILLRCQREIYQQHVS